MVTSRGKLKTLFLQNVVRGDLSTSWENLNRGDLWIRLEVLQGTSTLRDAQGESWGVCRSRSWAGRSLGIPSHSGYSMVNSRVGVGNSPVVFCASLSLGFQESLPVGGINVGQEEPCWQEFGWVFQDTRVRSMVECVWSAGSGLERAFQGELLSHPVFLSSPAQLWGCFPCSQHNSGDSCSLHQTPELL